MTHLSKNFTLLEGTRSQYASRHNIDNTPNNAQIACMKDTAVHVLQPIRDALGPVWVSSFFRCEELNKGIGGSPTSQHRLGQAADIELVEAGFSNLALAHWIAEKIPEFDQLILENYEEDKGPHSGWVHVSYRKGENRGQIFTKHKGDPVYYPGLPDL